MTLSQLFKLKLVAKKPVLPATVVGSTAFVPLLITVGLTPTSVYTNLYELVPVLFQEPVHVVKRFPVAEIGTIGNPMHWAP